MNSRTRMFGRSVLDEFNFLGAGCWNAILVTGVAFLMAGSVAQGQISTNARSGRFTRGTGSNPTYQSFVIPLDLEKGVQLDATNGNADVLFPGNTWTNVDYHYNATNAASSTNLSLRLRFTKPLAAFGNRVGGSPLYLNQDYHFAAQGGENGYTQFASFKIKAHSRTNFALLETTNVTIPREWQTNEWRQYLTNGYATKASFRGLETSFSRLGVSRWGTDTIDSYVLTHRATPTAPNYVFLIEVLGYAYSADHLNSWWMTLDAGGFGDWQRLYTVEFDERPASRSAFIDQPHFEGQLLPPQYYGKTLEELLSVAASIPSITFQAPTNYLQLNNSLE